MNDRPSIDTLERQLSSPDLEVRTGALEQLADLARSGNVECAEPGAWVNGHFHTIYSYNPYGYTPTQFAWEARKRGLAVAGIVDFDVFDGVDEFLSASRAIGLKAIAGLETRVFVPEFSDRVLNSPGEPGISYHMVSAVPRGTPSDEQRPFLDRLKQTAAERNRALIERVNPFTAPVVLEYEADVLPLTPNGNATERHICQAYVLKSERHFGGDEAAFKAFWSEKLGLADDAPEWTEEFKLSLTLRAKTMKKGGVGYVQPDGGSFPAMREVNEFAAAVGGLPMMTWLNGSSDGEQALDELLRISIGAGVCAANIVPDRNYTAGLEDERLRNLQQFVAACEANDLPILVGTEMNAPGLKFVDDFASAELAPLLPVFLKGALTLYGHSVLQRAADMGALSLWALEHFPDRKDRNAFYRQVGETCRPEAETALNINPNLSPDDVLGVLA